MSDDMENKVAPPGFDAAVTRFVAESLARAQQQAFLAGQVRQQGGVFFSNSDPKMKQQQHGSTEESADTSSWKTPLGIAQLGSGPRPSRRDPQRIGQVFQRLLRSRAWEQQVATGSVVANWSEIVGDDISLHCPVESFSAGVLVVRADSTAWAQQMRLLLPVLAKRIDDEVGAGAVTQILIKGPAGPSWKHGRFSVRGRGPRDTYG